MLTNKEKNQLKCIISNLAIEIIDSKKYGICTKSKISEYNIANSYLYIVERCCKNISYSKISSFINAYGIDSNLQKCIECNINISSIAEINVCSDITITEI